MKNNWSTVRSIAACLVVLVALSGCAAQKLSRDGLSMIAEGHYEEGLAKLEQAAKSDPSDFHYRAEFLKKREEVVGYLLIGAANERVAGHLDAAEKDYRRALAIEPGNERAKAGIAELVKDIRTVRRILTVC